MNNLNLDELIETLAAMERASAQAANPPAKD